MSVIYGTDSFYFEVTGQHHFWKTKEDKRSSAYGFIRIGKDHTSTKKTVPPLSSVEMPPVCSPLVVAEMSRFVGKVAIVTGSSNGIGQAAAVQLASEGASVTIHGRSLEGLQTTEKMILDKDVPAERILSVQGNIQDDETLKELVEKTLEKFGKIDVLVNNAGLAADPKLDKTSIEQYDYIHEVNLKSIIKLVQLVEPHLEKTKGNIVNVSSVSSSVAATFYFYAMSKAALDHYTR
uniref:Short-chain dehydrogenease/reductase-like protein n=1 Tax=Steinernema glaseri TaxID=37863 RepID=A0A1I7Z6T5_9BILA